MWDKNLSPSQYSNRKGIAIKPAPSATFLIYYFPISSFNLHAVHLSLPYNICGGTKLKAQEPGHTKEPQTNPLHLGAVQLMCCSASMILSILFSQLNKTVVPLQENWKILPTQTPLE